MHTWKEIEKMNVTKEELFKNENIKFDYSLPQDWLNDFSNFCEKYGIKISYDMISGTTVWGYTDENYYGFPIFACVEVYTEYMVYLINKFQEK